MHITESTARGHDALAERRAEPMDVNGPEGARPETLLIVDDTPANLAVIIDHLEDQGFEIAIAQDGEEAVERAELLRPDLILLDVVLVPGIDGFETCRRLKASASTREIPVIFMTALADTADKVAGFEAGGVDYVTKPFHLDEVVARVRTHVAMHAMRRKIAAQNAQLQREIAMREQFESALRLAHGALEQRVAERTVELAAANATLQEESAERKRALAALGESQHLLRAVIDNSTAVIYVKDVAGRYVLINRHFERLFHVTEASILGRTDDELFPPAQASAFRAFDRRVLDARTPLQAEELVMQDDGLHTYISIKCLLRDAADEPWAVCGISTDITERKRAEEEREALLAREQAAREKAEAADRLKDEFLATLSHELRTPLTSIVGWAQLLCTGTLDAATTRRGFESIQRNSLAEMQIIEDLLDVSAIVSGKMTLKAQPVCLASVLRAALDTLTLAADAKGVSVSLSLNPEAGKVWGDGGRLQQVVWNLLGNAVKFTPPGGRVAVSLDKVGATAQIRVSDTGEGISAEFLPLVFERFRQADSSIQRRRGGLGLGLSIVRDLVELHGGAVRAESGGPGQGATFTVELPLLPSAEEPAAPGAALAPRGRGAASPPVLAGLRVLVVDDAPDMRELMARLLSGAGAEVRVAGLAREGFELVEPWRPDVIVSDIGLPGEDGHALIRRVRALPAERGGATPAIALTAYAGQIARDRTLSEGYQMHIPKPVDPAALVEVIARLAHPGGSDLSRT
ncbi:response regulator [Sorangium sp. So ce385]|uniref:hybrid sensor histidine kinase/response regulator n=1 Tax=Sorangium sp. So ce385 TaxID=3133308 RepID=UPI003F5C968A